MQDKSKATVFAKVADGTNFLHNTEHNALYDSEGHVVAQLVEALRVLFPMLSLTFFIEIFLSARTMALGLTQPLTGMSKGKGKAVQLQAWSGPEGSRKLRFPDFMTTQDGGKVVSLTHRPPLPPGNRTGTHFC